MTDLLNLVVGMFWINPTIKIAHLKTKITAQKRTRTRYLAYLQTATAAMFYII